MNSKIQYIKKNLELSNIVFLEKEPMKKHTTFGIGGPVDIYILPKDNSELNHILEIINKTNIEKYETQWE